MIGSLYDSIESNYGSLATRLYRAFKPKPCKFYSIYSLVIVLIQTANKRSIWFGLIKIYILILICTEMQFLKL